MRIYKTRFKYSDATYRVSSFYYVYETTDGVKHYARCEESEATHVGGSGICGCMAPLDQIEVLEKETEIQEQFVKDQEKSVKRRTEKEKDLVEFLKNIPKGMNEEEYMELVLE